MKTKNESGRMVALAVGVYLVVKVLINMFLAGGSLNIGELILAVAEAAVLFTGLMYSNYIIAAILVIVMLVHLVNNLSNLGSNLIYLIEGIVDVFCAILLCVPSSVREHFSNTPSEIFGGGDE